jgi:opacity protein-like surface antigen
MKKITLALSILLLVGVSHKASAQYYFYNDKYYDNPVVYEVGGSIGFMNCLTDIGGRKGVGKKFVKDLNMGKTKFAGSIFVSAMYKYAAGLRLEATFGQVAADDKILAKVKETTFGRYERNLSFRSNITEFSAVAELHPFYIFGNYNDDNSADPPRFSPYLLAGVGFFSFKPQAQIGNTWVDLQPLSTEGQGFAEYPDRKQYKLNQMNIPLGLGVKYELNDLINLRAEFVYRKLNTDYLDDVSTTYVDPTLYANYFTGSKLQNALLLNDRQYELDPTHITQPGDQRGNSKNNDAYFSFNIKASFIFGRERVKR